MNVEKFNKMLEERIEKTRQVLDSKNKEYASNVDRLHNFKRAGKMLQCSPEKALVGMMVKHTISILDIVDKLDNGEIPTKEIIEEKIGDNVNYLILLEALIKERYEKTIVEIELYCGFGQWVDAGINNEYEMIEVYSSVSSSDGYRYYLDNENRIVYRIKEK